LKWAAVPGPAALRVEKGRECQKDAARKSHTWRCASCPHKLYLSRREMWLTPNLRDRPSTKRGPQQDSSHAGGNSR
jgi:hypothetical protein